MRKRVIVVLNMAKDKSKPARVVYQPTPEQRRAFEAAAKAENFRNVNQWAANKLIAATAK